MATNDYHFVTQWCFEAHIEEVADVLSQVECLASWWPTVYLSVRVIDPGDSNGIGKRMDLLTKGCLPYKFRWELEVVEASPPHGFTIIAKGDYVGRGVWTLTQIGDIARVEFDWQIRAEKPLLRRTSWALRPLVRWDHKWAMRQGQCCLCAEIKRRRRSAQILEYAL
jgi:hypothetical protein